MKPKGTLMTKNLLNPRGEGPLVSSKPKGGPLDDKKPVKPKGDPWVMKNLGTQGGTLGDEKSFKPKGESLGDKKL